MLGVPSLASDLPGVRMPVRHTGFGTIVPPRDSDAIARGLAALAEADLDREQGAALSRELYLAENVVDRHAELFDRIARS